MPNIATLEALASESKLTVSTVRYYEDLGLLGSSTKGKPHLYTEADLLRLRLVKGCCDSGFSMDDVADLFRLFESSSCDEVADLVNKQLIALTKKIAKMRELQSTLIDFVRIFEGAGVQYTSRVARPRS